MSERPQPLQHKPHRLAFVDIETTGLDPDRHEPWEIAVICEVVGADGSHTVMSEQTFYPRATLTNAEPRALEIGGYYHRAKPDAAVGWYCSDTYFVGDGPGVARHLVRAFTHQELPTYLVGCTVHFDAAFLEVFMRKHGQCPMWDYHLLDATVYAAGRLGMRPPWKSKKVAEQYGIALDDKDAHNALNDARLARDLYWAAHDRAQT